MWAGERELPRPYRLLRGETAARGRHRGKRVLRLRQRPGFDGHGCRLCRDRDLLARRRIASLAGLRRLLHADGELDDAPIFTFSASAS